MQPAGAHRAQLSSTLTTAYGRGLLSEHTLAQRLEALADGCLIDPDLLIGDLCMTRPEDSLSGRLRQTMVALREGLTRLIDGAERVPVGLLALDWSGSGAELTVGRSRGCDVVLTDLSVSRRHARLRCVDGGWALEDLGSSNGTRRNGRAVGRCEVRPGDALQFGSVTVRID